MAVSNIYEAGAADILELFADFYEGGPSLTALSVSARPLGDDARNAIDKSLASFGYGADCCTYASIAPRNPEAEGGDVQLDPQSLFLLVEALDPLLLIVADEHAARIVAQAYRTGFDLDVPARVFGRPTVVFRELEALLTTNEGKQRAWAVLKSLPKR